MEQHTPKSTVMGWWLTMQTRKLDALEHMTLPDYIAVGGPFGRTIGREVMLKQAKEFLFRSTIEDWSVTDLEERTTATSACARTCGPSGANTTARPTRSAASPPTSLCDAGANG